MKKRSIGVICLFLVMLLSVGCGTRNTKSQSEEQTEEAIDFELSMKPESGTYSCRFEGKEHELILDIPEDAKGAPLVVMLHGYGGNAESFRSDTAFEKDANEKGYAVLYVTGAPNPNDSTSATGWNFEGLENGNRDVEFLCELARCVCEQCDLDASRVFAVGFSNGAFMAHRLAMEGQDTFAAVVSVAGMMSEGVWEKRNDKNQVSVFQITGEKDDVVPKNSDGSARFSKAPAIEDVMEYWAASNGLTLTETANVGKKSILTTYALSNDNDGQVSTCQVWHLWIPDGRHSWPSEQITGVQTNQLILEFLLNAPPKMVYRSTI